MNATDYLTVGRASSGSPLLRVRLLSAIARLVGIQFHIGGWPYGASMRRAVNVVPVTTESAKSSRGGNV